MGIQQLRRSYVAFAYHVRDARNRQFQLLGIRNLGNEQSALRHARERRFREHVDLLYRCVRRS